MVLFLLKGWHKPSAQLFLVLFLNKDWRKPSAQCILGFIFAQRLA